MEAIPLSKHEHKPLQVNPIKLSQPMGATLAFLGIADCLPLMHGAQGCASYTKVFYTRHFNEPIAVYNTSVSDITAVLDGGDYSILMAIENITKKNPAMKPALIGLCSTGLTETKGDDIRSIAPHVELPYAYVHTPDYEGGLESGWALSVKALIEQHTQPAQTTQSNKLVLFVHVSFTPLETEKLKEFCESFGFEVLACPDLSTSLDGFLSEGQGKLGAGGITLEDIRYLATCAHAITIGESMKAAANALSAKNGTIVMRHFDSLAGLTNSDAFVAYLMQIRHIDPRPNIKRWRGRLQDAMLDTHFLIGSSKFVVLGESDMCVGMCELLQSVGGTIEAVVATTYSPILERIKAEHVFVGDLEDAQKHFCNVDLVVGNFHVERLLHEEEKEIALVLRGYPNYEELGNALKSDILYEGSTLFLFEVANKLREVKHHLHL